MDIPGPFECIGVRGVLLGALGIVVGLPMLLVWDISPWGWYLVVSGGTLAGLSFLYCWGWEWDHLPFPGS